MQGSRRDSESAGAKNISDVLEIDTKANFQEHNPCKVRFRKSREGGGYGPPCPPPHPLMGHGAFEINKKRSEVWQLNNINIRRVTTNNMNCLLCYNTKIYKKTNISTYGSKSKILTRR